MYINNKYNKNRIIYYIGPDGPHVMLHRCIGKPHNKQPVGGHLRCGQDLVS